MKMNWIRKKLFEQKLKRKFKSIFRTIHKKTGLPYSQIAIATIRLLNSIDDNADWSLTITNKKTKEIVYSSSK